MSWGSHWTPRGQVREGGAAGGPQRQEEARALLAGIIRHLAPPASCPACARRPAAALAGGAAREPVHGRGGIGGAHPAGHQAHAGVGRGGAVAGRRAGVGRCIDQSSAGRKGQRCCCHVGTMQPLMLPAHPTTPPQNARYLCTGETPDDSFWRHFALAVSHYTHFTSPIRCGRRVLPPALPARAAAAMMPACCVWCGGGVCPSL